ncbi:ATP-binding protein [Ponticaulis profundi]|uniref:ATP-binding protein n=1 Tax=Ponticaulis profundi TaxID=2665222 RepID=A0ABW1S5J6_9PROT
MSKKRELPAIDGTPRKRMFLSIISDYDLRTGLCELVDNALDLWTANGRPPGMSVEIVLDANRQIISVMDNAGGVKESQLDLLIAPGASRNISSEEVIGIFGVGGKRAGVALGEHVVIKTHAKGQKSLQVDLTKEWLESEDWTLPAYEIPSISIGTTEIEITKLRQSFDVGDVERMRSHLGEVYGWFIDQGCDIRLNGETLSKRSFDHWAYPPGFSPKEAELEIEPAEGRTLKVRVTAGLIVDRNPELENYGIYFYCNNRLIVKDLRSREVGYFVKSEAGVPHPDASLCRVIVEMHGPAEAMPWNSSKSGINYSHPAFVQLRQTIITFTTFFSSLSRRLKNSWDDDVFAHPKGRIESVPEAELKAESKIVLPKLPRVRKLPYQDRILESNKQNLKSQPWTRGLVEAMALVNTIRSQKLDTKNRAALILLDSNFEIALKEFIVNRQDLFPAKKYNDRKISELFNRRYLVINEVKPHVSLDEVMLAKINHYYGLRNKLIHERATVGITDQQIEDYTSVIEKVLRKLFQIKFPRN